MAPIPSPREIGRDSRKESDVLSITSSIELKDALIDDTWFWQGETHSAKPTGKKWLSEASKGVGATAGDDIYAYPPIFFVRWFRAWQDRSLLKRLDKFDMDEVKTFVAQKLFKVDGIICDEQTKLMLIEKMVLLPHPKEFDDENEELIRKYGSELVKWLRDRLVPCTNQSKNVVDRALKDFNDLKQVDPLASWFKQSSESSARMLDRIQNLASAMADMVKYSLLIEPGTITPHLSEFVGEYRQLKTFFERNDMSPEECSRVAFAANYLTKARNAAIECADSTRVILHNINGDIESPFELLDDSMCGSSPSGLFYDDDVPSPCKPPIFGTSDFIHASYVRGGPLLNTFICTQAPMPSTINDFWQMVWQERSQYIIMLCAAVDQNRMCPLDSGTPNVCPYYWPRAEGEEMHCGPFIIRNERIDGVMDPLFNVTYLSIRRADDLSKKDIRLTQHWQYDWNDFADSHWPLRVLRRARLSPTPTIVQCMDGCSRSGTLVCIEALLMHVLRGSAQYEKLVLTTALFVRLQRRHAIGSPLHYLFIYRTLLYWMQPYITSIYQRFVLGLIFPEWGFVGKYNKLVAKHAAKLSLL
uniref:Tyrosine-protein phosphatase 69D n=1 Tax=Ascaris suum TaxID=6253 RepID=F1L2C0_ASCSU